MKIQVVGDKGTRGTVYLPENLPVSVKDSVFKVNGKVVKKTSFSVKKGQTVEIVQIRK
jgi:sulfur carrier protein ThiS